MVTPINYLRNNFVSFHFINDINERILSVPKTQETMLFALVHAIQHTLSTKYHIRKPKRRHFLQFRRRKPILLHHLFPHRTLLLHSLRQAHRLFILVKLHITHLKLFGQYLPQVLPFEQIPVAAIKPFILRIRIHCCPDLV